MTAITEVPTEAVTEVPTPEVETKSDEERYVPCAKCKGRVDLTRIPAKVRHLDHSTLLCKKCAQKKSAAKANRTQGPKQDTAPQRQPRTPAPQPPAVEPQTPEVLVPLQAVREALSFFSLPSAQVDIIISMLETRAASTSNK